MIPHYGKREPGSLTAASPGDTLYFNFGSYNDSGDSEGVVGTLAVTDIEVFKNGAATARATDSGYSLISDTGQLGDRVGLNRFSISLFNTADDASFYATGAWYQVAVDSVTIDGKTVRLWVGSFEIGFASVNVTTFADTGVNNRLSVIAADTDTGIQSSVNVTTFADTGVNNRLSVIASDTDTGIQSSVNVTAFADTGVNLRLAIIAADTDTGIQSSVTATNVTGFSDTGINNRLSVIAADTDTGIQSSVNVTTFADTGVNDRLARILSDTDTGIQSGVTVTGLSDTGVNERLTAIEAKTDKLTFDTGNEILADIRKVNQITVVGAGDTGAGNTWRPQ